MATAPPIAQRHQQHPETPKLKADQSLRAFRAECRLSWDNFTVVWMSIREFISAPCNDALFDPTIPTPYHVKLAELTSDLLLTGNFGIASRGKWVFGQYSPEPHREAFTLFVGRMVAYAVRKAIDDIPAPTGNPNYTFQGDKVGGWLTNAPWEQFRTVPRQVVDSEDSTHIISNSGASFTIVGNSNDGSTTVADTVVYQGNTGGRSVSGGTVGQE